MNLGKLKRLIIKEIRNLKEQGAGPRPSGPGGQIVGNNPIDFIQKMTALLRKSQKQAHIPELIKTKPILAGRRLAENKNACDRCGNVGDPKMCFLGSCIYGQGGKLKWDIPW